MSISDGRIPFSGLLCFVPTPPPPPPLSAVMSSDILKTRRVKPREAQGLVWDRTASPGCHLVCAAGAPLPSSLKVLSAVPGFRAPPGLNEAWGPSTTPASIQHRVVGVWEGRGVDAPHCTHPNSLGAQAFFPDRADGWLVGRGGGRQATLLPGVGGGFPIRGSFTNPRLV